MDSDGDCANEFYIEKQGQLIRIRKGLHRIGHIKLDTPTLNPDLDILLLTISDNTEK